MNTITISTEQQYLEMSAQLKESYERFESENKELEAQNMELKKEIMAIYGLSRALDLFYSDYIVDDNKIMEYLIESIRATCSGAIDAHIIDDDS